MWHFRRGELSYEVDNFGSLIMKPFSNFRGLAERGRLFFPLSVFSSDGDLFMRWEQPKAVAAHMARRAETALLLLGAKS